MSLENGVNDERVVNHWLATEADGADQLDKITLGIHEFEEVLEKYKAKDGREEKDFKLLSRSKKSLPSTCRQEMHETKPGESDGNNVVQNGDFYQGKKMFKQNQLRRRDSLKLTNIRQDLEDIEEEINQLTDIEDATTTDEESQYLAQTADNTANHNQGDESQQVESSISQVLQPEISSMNDVPTFYTLEVSNSSGQRSSSSSEGGKAGKPQFKSKKVMQHHIIKQAAITCQWFINQIEHLKRLLACKEETVRIQLQELVEAEKVNLRLKKEDKSHRTIRASQEQQLAEYRNKIHQLGILTRKYKKRVEQCMAVFSTSIQDKDRAIEEVEKQLDEQYGEVDKLQTKCTVQEQMFAERCKSNESASSRKIGKMKEEFQRIEKEHGKSKDEMRDQLAKQHESDLQVKLREVQARNATSKEKLRSELDTLHLSYRKLECAAEDKDKIIEKLTSSLHATQQAQQASASIASTQEHSKTREDLARANQSIEANRQLLDERGTLIENQVNLIQLLRDKLQENGGQHSGVNRLIDLLEQEQSSLMRTSGSESFKKDLQFPELEKRLQTMQSTVKDRDRRIAELDKAMAARDAELTERDRACRFLEEHCMQLEAQMAHYKAEKEQSLRDVTTKSESSSEDTASSSSKEEILSFDVQKEVIRKLSDDLTEQEARVDQLLERDLQMTSQLKQIEGEKHDMESKFQTIKFEKEKLMKILDNKGLEEKAKNVVLRDKDAVIHDLHKRNDKLTHMLHLTSIQQDASEKKNTACQTERNSAATEMTTEEAKDDNSEFRLKDVMSKFDFSGGNMVTQLSLDKLAASETMGNLGKEKFTTNTSTTTYGDEWQWGSMVTSAGQFTDKLLTKESSNLKLLDNLTKKNPKAQKQSFFTPFYQSSDSVHGQVKRPAIFEETPGYAKQSQLPESDFGLPSSLNDILKGVQHVIDRKIITDDTYITMRKKSRRMNKAEPLLDFPSSGNSALAPTAFSSSCLSASQRNNSQLNLDGNQALVPRELQSGGKSQSLLEAASHSRDSFQSIPSKQFNHSASSHGFSVSKPSRHQLDGDCRNRFEFESLMSGQEARSKAKDSGITLDYYQQPNGLTQCHQENRVMFSTPKPKQRQSALVTAEDDKIPMMSDTCSTIMATPKQYEEKWAQIKDSKVDAYKKLTTRK